MSNQVRVERAGNRILLGSAFPIAGLKEAIPGAYFRQAEQVWSVPLDLTTCHLLRDRFGRRLVIGPALAEWARAEKAQRTTQKETAAAGDAELARLPAAAPRLYEAMTSRPYQKAAIAFVQQGMGRDDRRRALIADTVGLGKTLEAIGAVLETGVEGPYLVVCPKTAVETTWAPEIRQWLGEDAEVVTLPDGKPARTRILHDLVRRSRPTLGGQERSSLANTWVIVHPAVVRTQTWFICPECGAQTKYKAGFVEDLDCGHRKTRQTKVSHDHTFPDLFKLEYGSVIADESDQILIRLTGTPNLQRRGMEMLRDRVKEGGARIAMSGTPFRSKPHQIWSTLNWLDPVRWSAKWSWVARYWKVSQGGYGGYSIGEIDEEREHLLVDELADVMIRRTREQVRGDLPPKIYPSNVQDRSDLTQGIYLPMTGDQERAYRAMEKSGEAAIEGGTLTALGVLAEMTRLKQFAGAPGILVNETEFKPTAGGNKYEWILEFMEELGFPDRPATKLVIASQFTQILNAFAPALAKEFAVKRNPLPYGMITGETKRREEVVGAFEDVNSGLDLLFINTKAGGSSITLDAAEIMVVLDETWVDDEQQQLEGRIDNRKPERKIAPRSYYYLRSLNSIEEGIARRNAEAKARGDRLLNGGQFAQLGKEALR